MESKRGRDAIANRRASGCVIVLTFIYILHWVMVFQVAPQEKRTAGNLVGGVAVGAIVSAAFVWAALAAWRGGRLLGSFVAAGLCFFGGAMGTALSIKQGTTLLFTVVEVLLTLWGAVTFGMLVSAHNQRQKHAAC